MLFITAAAKSPVCKICRPQRNYRQEHPETVKGLKAEGRTVSSRCHCFPLRLKAPHRAAPGREVQSRLHRKSRTVLSIRSGFLHSKSSLRTANSKWVGCTFSGANTRPAFPSLTRRAPFSAPPRLSQQLWQLRHRFVDEAEASQHQL